MNTTRFEIEQRSKDGSWIWTEITAAPHYDKHNNLIGYHGISRDISEQKQLREELQQLAFVDELTNIPNRRHFLALAEKEISRAKRYQHALSIVIIDIDQLKQTNDTYGHYAGDRALRDFVIMTRSLIREVDIIGRFAGDEFLILFPETDADRAYQVMERIGEKLAASPIFYEDEQFLVSMSYGIASLDLSADTVNDLIKKADQALYKAKNQRDKTSLQNSPGNGKTP